MVSIEARIQAFEDAVDACLDCGYHIDPERRDRLFAATKRLCYAERLPVYHHVNYWSIELGAPLSEE